jgi:parallel beta-helix repeat protein
MNSRNSINSGVRLSAALVVGVGTLLAAPNVRSIDCPRQSLGDAVAKADPGDTLRVTGICHERVVITTDRLTIDGQGTAVIDGGGGSGGEFSAAILIDGAQGITVRGFTVHNSSNGILGQSNAAFKVQNTRIQDNAREGIFTLDASNAEISDCTINHNGHVGVRLLNNSVAVFKGSVTANNNLAGMMATANSSVEVRGGSLEASGNTLGGIALDGSSFRIIEFTASLGSSVTANNNGTHGFVIAGSQLIIFGPAANHLITAMNNKGSGIFLPGSSVLVNARNESGGKFVLKENGIGLNVGTDATIQMPVGGLDVEDNGTGLLADGAGSLLLLSVPQNPIIIRGNRSVDVDLRFGTRMTVDAAILGTVKCDATVLSRGSTRCP